MRIAEFALDGNGAWPDLRARSLADGLTAFFGPPGTGKSTVAGFIGHVLYGRQSRHSLDATACPRLQPEGELIVQDAADRYCLRRYNDVAPPGRLTVSSLDGRTVDQHTVTRLLAGGPTSIVSQLYLADFQTTDGLPRLLSHDFARGLHALLGHDARPAERIAPHANARRLLVRRDELARELEARLATGRRQSRELEDRLAELEALRNEQRQEVDQLGQRLRAVESELAEIEARLRYGRLEALVDQEQSASVPANLDGRLSEVDEQIDRWRTTLAELECREAGVRARLAQLHPDDATNELPLADQRAFLGVVRRLVADLEGEVARLAQADGQQRCVCREAHRRLRPIAETLGKQTALLDQSLAEQARIVEYLDLEGEAEHLARSKSELQQQLGHLLDRRQMLLRSARPTRRRVARETAVHGHNGQHGLSPQQFDELATRRAQLDRDRAELRERLAVVERSLEDLTRRWEGLARNRAGLLAAAPIEQIRSELAAVEIQLQALSVRDADSAGAASHDDALRASDYLAQLSSGELVQLRQSARGPATVVHRDGNPMPIDALPPTERDLAYLALTLSLVAAHARRGVALPLVLDEPFDSLHQHQIAPVAAVLDEFGRAGHQVFVFTHRAAAIERFQSLGTTVRGMHELRCASDADVELRPGVPSTNGDPEPTRQAVASPKAETQPPATPDGFQLHLEDPIGRFPALGAETDAAFARIDIRTVGDLIAADPADVTKQLDRGGINEAVVRLWQTHQVLMCFVPGVSLDDAQVLTGAGVYSVDELLAIGERELADRLHGYLQGPRGLRFRERGYRVDARRLAQWQSGGRQFRDRWVASTQAARWRRRRTDRTQPTKPLATSKKIVDEPPTAPVERGSPVVDAPSIGPKTAARLGAIGIRTIDDLLFADADEVAEKLDVRHITAEKIATWQQQAHLVCELPRLRSHDARILVACGLADLAKIAKMRTRELLDVVLPFCETTEGERLLRGSNKPDEAECANWIAWARARQSLEAA